MSGWGSKKPSTTRARSKIQVKQQPSIVNELLHLEEMESEDMLRNLSANDFVERVQHFSRLVEQIKTLQIAQLKTNSKTLAAELRQLRIEANAEANKLKKVKQFKNWGRKTSHHSVSTIENENDRIIIRRAVQEFDNMVAELKDLIERARDLAIQKRTPPRNNSSETVPLMSVEVHTDEQIDGELMEAATYGIPKRTEEEKMSYRLADWQSSTLQVENMIARESYERTIEMVNTVSILTIKSTDYTELKFLFENFKEMVDNQDEYIEKIGSDVAMSRVNVERGVEEITKADNLRKAQRWRYYAILAFVVLGFLLILGGILMAIFVPDT